MAAYKIFAEKPYDYCRCRDIGVPEEKMTWVGHVALGARKSAYNFCGKS